MSTVFCPNGHENPTDSRFCRFCGEPIRATPSPDSDQGDVTPPPLPTPSPDNLVGLRYQVTRQLGHGGFGRTYLATDVQRFNEPCVLKEFAPKVEGREAIQKAEHLFEREAGVLYRLHHSQIPRFRELLRAEFEGRDRLFLVQDYVDGPTYQELLDHRLKKGRGFAEPEILEFLSQILPVLDYIHQTGVIHRDIAPDNLILRNDDQRPVLIDFGGVKQAAVTIESELTRSPHPSPEVTLVGKQGFAPREQMQEGRVKPHCDLYALAVTVLVLMTGLAPGDLLDRDAPTYWEREVERKQLMGPLLTAVLKQMLSDRPHDRYPSAQAVMQALGLLRMASPPPQPQPAQSASNAASPPAPPSPPPTPTAHTVAVSPAAPQPAVPTRKPSPVTRPAPPPASSPPSHQSSSNNWQGVLSFLLILALAGVGGWVGYQWVPQWLNLDQGDDTTEPEPGESGGNLDTNSPQVPPEELARKEALRSRRDALGVDNAFLIRLTDARFYDEYPRQRGRRLTESPDDAQWRERWDAIAADWLDTLEAHLSADARRKLGNYGEGDRNQWRQAVNQLHVSSNALYDLVDAQFVHTFPDQQNQNFINQPIGQIWHGMAADQVRAMQAGQTLDNIRFPEGETSQELRTELAPGGGHVYTLNATQNQYMEVDVDAPRGNARLSIYVPNPTDDVPYLLEDARSLSWSGTLPQSGYYEVAIVSVANKPIDVRLNVSVENQAEAN